MTSVHARRHEGEVELVSRLMDAAAAAQEPLSQEEVDAILGVAREKEPA